ncbi:MAG: hypothetical protein ACXIVQ_10160 [Acidimicrobiales bacterium]
MERDRARDEHTVAEQLLTADAVALALDPSQHVSDAAIELVRRAGGDVELLEAVAANLTEMTRTRPGVSARRATGIVEAALRRARSLQRHPSRSVPFMHLVG